MKREVLIHFSFWFSIFVFTSIFKNTLSLNLWPFFVGGVVGTILPDIDHIIYLYLVRPYEFTSQRFNQLVLNKEIKRGVELLYETREERKNLIFHTKFFQIIFLIVTFWIMSSSGSLFGRGVAFAFAIHLAIDQLIDGLSENDKIYFYITLLLTLIVGFV